MNQKQTRYLRLAQEAPEGYSNAFILLSSDYPESDAYFKYGTHANSLLRKCFRNEFWKNYKVYWMVDTEPENDLKEFLYRICENCKDDFYKDHNWKGSCKHFSL